LCLKHCTWRLPSKKRIRLKSSAWVWSFETYSLLLHTLVYDPLYISLICDECHNSEFGIFMLLV
jgi:hypothetical protein